MQIPLDYSDSDKLHKSASKGKFLSAFHLNVGYDVLNHRSSCEKTRKHPAGDLGKDDTV